MISSGNYVIKMQNMINLIEKEATDNENDSLYTSDIVELLFYGHWFILTCGSSADGRIFTGKGANFQN